MFLNKAQNLNHLSKFKITNVEIPKFIFFNVEEWKTNKNLLVDRVTKSLGSRICIRSSFYKEDSSKSSLAGKFESFIDIKNNKKNIIISVTNLINQYKKFDKNKKFFLKNYLIIQNFVKNSICSGVITNYTLSDGAPYYSINYNDQTSSTLSVTAGDKNSYRVIHISRNSKKNIRSIKFKKIIHAIKKIENIYHFKPLDIEFALNKNYKVFILQIRPISTSFKWRKINQNKFNNLLKINERKFKKISKRNSIYGNKPIFGLMPDWNPAEIIGFQPNLFSYSLYKFLVTDEIWSKAREEMGYKKLKKPKLMYSFTGKPYIDLRMSFNSFLPKDLNRKIQKKITNYWISQLVQKPYLHDKIEFEITDNCYYFGLEKKVKKNYYFLSQDEKKIFINSLKLLTNNILKNYKNEFYDMKTKLLDLENFRILCIEQYLNEKNNINISKKLLEKCKYLGLMPFSKQARNAFISKKILTSLIDTGILSKSSYYKILSHLKTVSHDYISDQKRLRRKKINIRDFEKKYYHLRPNTYDIVNKRYNEKIMINKIENFELEKILNFDFKNPEKLLTRQEFLKLSKVLKKEKINIDVKNLLIFCIASLKLRENYKFIFSRSLSDGIQLLRNYSLKMGLTEQFSNVDLSTIFKIQKNADLRILRQKFYEYKNQSEYFNFVKLPYLIVSNNDFFVSSILLSKPNFITDKNISGKLIFLDGKSKKKTLKNMIVVIENADPGFDWIFSHKIKGLITKFGGINSHMSIRCEELNVPAIIGFGEDNYSRIIYKKKLSINCKLQKISFEE